MYPSPPLRAAQGPSFVAWPPQSLNPPSQPILSNTFTPLPPWPSILDVAFLLMISLSSLRHAKSSAPHHSHRGHRLLQPLLSGSEFFQCPGDGRLRQLHLLQADSGPGRVQGGHLRPRLHRAPLASLGTVRLHHPVHLLRGFRCRQRHTRQGQTTSLQPGPHRLATEAGREIRPQIHGRIRRLGEHRRPRQDRQGRI